MRFLGLVAQLTDAGIDFLQLLVVLLPLRKARVEIAQDGIQFPLAVAQFLQTEFPDTNLFEKLVVFSLQFFYNLLLRFVFRTIFAKLLLQFV